MIPVLFKEDEQVFSHNGIGALYESLSCDVIEEENGAFTMELEYPVDGEWFSEIKDFRIIQAKPNDIDEPHNFRIYEIEKSIDELTVYVRANTRTNDLGNNLITNYIGKNVTPQQAMNGIKSNLIEPTNFDLISDIQTRSNVEWTRINPLNAIVGVRGSLVDIWGGQIKRTNTAIHLYSRRGRDNVVTIRPGKNIEGLNMTVSTAGLVTKILPTYSYRPVDVPKYQMVTMSDGSKEKRRVSTSGSITLRDDITVLGDVVSSQYVDNYPTNYWSSVDYGDDNELRETINDYIDTRLTAAEESPTILDMSGFENDLQNFVKTELDKKANQYFTHRNPGADKPTVRITVNMLQLSDSPDWEEFKDLERIGLTDTLDVWVEEYDIDVEVRVTTLTYDSIGEQVTIFNAGSDRAPRQSAIEKKYDDLTKATNDYITSFKNGVQNIMRNTADGLNRKFEGYTEPPAELSSEGDIWFKQIGEGKVEIWIHDGVYWQPLMTEDFGKKIEADIEAIQSELDEAKLKAVADSEQALTDAKAHAEAEDARIRGELELDIGGAITLAEEAKADAVSKANQALEDAKAHADAEIVLIGTHFDGIIEGVESDVANAQVTADSAVAQIDTAVTNAGFTSLDETISNVRSISNTAQTNAQTALDQSQDALGDASTALTNAQTALNKADGLSGDISDINLEIDDINSSLSLKANTTTVNDLTGRVSTAETGITANANAIALKASQSSVDTLTGRVNTAETSITANATAIGLKAEQSTVDTLTGTVNTLSGRVDVTAGQISSKVWSTDIQTAIDGIEVGGRNLIKESDPLYAWVGEHNVTTNSGAIVYRASPHYPATYQIEVRAVDDSVVGAEFGWQWSSRLQGKSVIVSKEWKKATAYLEESRTIGLGVRGGLGRIEVRHIKAERGNIATDWTPAPEDTTALINHVESELTQKHDSITATVSSIDGRVATNELNLDGLTTTVQSVETDLKGTTTSLNATKTTVDSHTSSISTLRTDVDGKATTTQFNTLNSTVNGTIQRVGDAEGRLTTVETNISGIQTTVAGKASQSQVTQLSNLLSSTVEDVEDNATQISQNATNINLRVEKGDVLSQINIEAEQTLIQSNKLVLDASSVIFTGSAFIPSAQIQSIHADKITAGTINTARLNSTAIVTAGLTANVIKSTHIETSTATVDKIFATDVMVNRLTAKTAFITSVKAVDIDAARITTGTINAARLNASDIVTAGLSANVVKASHISGDTALFDKLFSTSSATDRLSAQTAWIKTANIGDLAITNAKIANGTIASAKIASLDVSKISGNIAEFVRVGFNGVNSWMQLDSDGIHMSGSGSWRRTYITPTGFDLYNGVGGSNKAGAIGYFKEHPNSANSNENYMRTTEGGQHFLGIGVNRNHSFAIGYNEYITAPNGYDRALVVNGISGAISLLRSTTMGNGIRLWFNGGSYIGEAANSQHFNINAKGQIRLYNSINSLKVQIGANFDMYSDLNMNSNNIYNNSDRNLKKNILSTKLNSLNAIKEWEFVDYEWIDGSKEGIYMGVIAQETPELAVYNSESNQWSINSSKQIMMNSHAVQQLALKELNTNRVASQALQATETNEEKIERLERRIEELESGV